MCGRFVVYHDLDQLKRYLPIDRADCEVTASYNVAPSQQVLAIYRVDNVNVLDRLHWGLVPFWAKDISIGNKMINARMETVVTKPSFRESFRRRRCLIPADGFFEWMPISGQKIPVFVTQPDESPLAFAGLWDVWHDKQNPETVYRSCTIITRDSSDCLRKVHDRMPAVLHPDTYAAWLDPDNRDVAQLHNLLSNQTRTEFVFRPVSKQVNSVHFNDPVNIRPIQTEFVF